VAARWWTRSGLFRDGACFLSFERFMGADRVVQVLGGYCEGPRFEQRSAAEQRRGAIELFRQRDLLMVWDNFESALPQFNKRSDDLFPHPNPLPEGEGDLERATRDSHSNEGLAGDASPYTDEERRRLADLFRDLAEGPGRGCLLVTCRPGETGLPGAQRLKLHGLARPDSLWLLHRILERDGLSLSDPRLARDRLDPLLRDLADHPLSLELVGPHLRSLTPEAIRADFGKLLDRFRQDADQDRNRSLLASLELSRRHLSPAARKALPWLGLFSGGVFEQLFLDVSRVESAAWEPICTELQGIALLRAEDDIQIGDRPFLRFHPALAIASADGELLERPETRERFVRVYLAVMQMLNKMLRGS
jgi:hypothetical protein